PLVIAETNNFLGQQQQNDYEQSLKVQNLQPPEEVTREQADARIELLQGLEKDFVASHPGVAPHSHQTAYDRAVRLMRTAAASAFRVEEEAPALRDAYGRNLFGQGCLLARRLIERGVPFVEVTLSATPGSPQGWDTHQGNFDAVKSLSQTLDPGFATLI